LKEGTSNYVSVKVQDFAGNTTQLNDVFYVKKDTTPPTISDLQSGDTIWRISNNGYYNVDFSDSGFSKIKNFQTVVYSGENKTGDLIDNWRIVVDTINSNSYTANWQIKTQTWDLLPPGTSYITVKVFDNALNQAEVTDAFYIRKDTSPPVITDNQTGDDVWRSSNTATYDVDYSDVGSLLDYAQYQIKSGTGGVIVDWYTYASGINSNSYTTNFSLLTSHFNLLPSSYNYVSVRVFDRAGSSTTLNNVFYIKKDTTPPSVSDNQTGDNTWRKENIATYNIDFTDDVSGIDKAEVKITTGPGQTGILVSDWSPVLTDIDSLSFTTNWKIHPELARWEFEEGEGLTANDSLGNHNKF